jgi:hypothetical protein
LALRGQRYEETGENFTVRSFMIYTAFQILFGCPDERTLRIKDNADSTGENRHVYRGLMEKPEGKRPPGRLSIYNIKMDFN